MKTNTPLVTVMIPTYNVENYIEECLESVFNQTFQDFDILIIDDCSTDNTIDIIKSFNEPRINIIKKPKNKGLIDSLNIGFDLCTAKYIARVDGDDINGLDRFEKQFNFLESNLEIDACGSWLQCFGSSNRLIKHKETHEEIMCAMFHTAPINIGATMFRRQAYKSYSFDLNMRHAEDYDFWARTGYTKKMHNLQEALYYYRVHKEQVCRVHRTEQLQNKTKIKILLWKKFEYNQQLYSDSFLIKMLMSSENYTKNDFVLLKKWRKYILRKNKELGIYNPNFLEMTLQEIFDNILSNTFMKNRRNVTKSNRLLLFTVISPRWIIIGIINLIRLKRKKYFLN